MEVPSPGGRGALPWCLMEQDILSKHHLLAAFLRPIFNDTFKFTHQNLKSNHVTIAMTNIVRTGVILVE